MIPLLLGVLPAQNTAQPTDRRIRRLGRFLRGPLGLDAACRARTRHRRWMKPPPSRRPRKRFRPERVARRSANCSSRSVWRRSGQPFPRSPRQLRQPRDSGTPEPEDSLDDDRRHSESRAVHPATPATVGAVAPGQSEMPLSLADAPDMGTSAPAIPPAAVPQPAWPAGSTAAARNQPRSGFARRRCRTGHPDKCRRERPAGNRRG